jgi:hypothetical protein
MKKLLLIAICFGFFISCKSYVRYPTVRNNVCQTLEKEVVLYAIFVDSDKTHPWTSYDIKSTMDSIRVSISWLQRKAAEKGLNLTIRLNHAQKDGTIPFKEAFKYGSLSGTLFKYPDLSKGIKLVDEWADNVAKDVARTLPDDTASFILTKNKSNDRERMIAKLRNVYETDNIAVMYFINNYFENEISVALHTASNVKTEYCVVSTKKPAVIAHEFLHLFGAIDLYVSPFDRKLRQRAKKRKAIKRYPKEIMAFTYKRLDSLEISPMTQYLIGWESKLSPKEYHIVSKRRWRFLEY